MGEVLVRALPTTLWPSHVSLHPFSLFSAAYLCGANLSGAQMSSAKLGRTVTLYGHDGPVSGVAFCQLSETEEVLVSVSDDASVRLWDFRCMPGTLACVLWTLCRGVQVQEVRRVRVTPPLVIGWALVAAEGPELELLVW